MSAPAEKGPAHLGAAPLNFIYACSLCGASFADVYDGHNETVRGLSDGINPKERLVARLFLASCCHVFCGSHLEGGGPPFHSEKERPKAPCPVCIKEQGASEPQSLYSIRGFNKNEYDPLIPSSWFTAPPIRLDGSGKEMDALRFQYIALIRYCQNAYMTRQNLEQALKESKKKFDHIQDLASEEHTRLLSLQKENEQLQLQKDQFEAMKAEVQRLRCVEQELEQFRKLNVNSRDLETFVTNKSEIRHYLKLVPMLIDQNVKMKKRLAQLGFAMALEPVPNFKGVDPSVFDSEETLRGNDNGDSSDVLRKTTSSHTIGRSVHAAGRVGTATSSPYVPRPMKRQRLESPLPGDMQANCSSGRHAMPPPSKTLSRMQSVRRILPSLKKKFSIDRSSPMVQERREDDYYNHFHDMGKSRSTKDTGQHVCDEFHSEPPYMSGALLTGQPTGLSDTRSPRLLGNVERYENESDLTFRASSPAKGVAHKNDHCTAQLPIEPSYIRLMDSLSRDHEVELELKDPRDSYPSSYHGEDRERQVAHTYENQPGLRNIDRQEPRNLSNHPIHQLQHKSSVTVGNYRQPLQYGPTNVYTNRNYNRSNLGHSTPTPGRNHHLGNPIESVVSPYFKSGHRQAQIYSPSGLAERQHSSSRSVIYQSQRSPVSKPRPTWPEPRGLNGLSFFDIPVSPRNKLGRRTLSSKKVVPTPMLSSHHHQNRYLDSSGFIRQPETEHPQYWRDAAYAPLQSQTPLTREPPRYNRTVTNSCSQKYSTYNRIGKVLPTVPFIAPGRFSAYSESQWKKLQRAGVRSSQNARGDLVGNKLGVPSQHVLPVPGRRNIVR